MVLGPGLVASVLLASSLPACAGPADQPGWQLNCIAEKKCELKYAQLAEGREVTRLLVYKAARLKDLQQNFTLTAAQAKLKTGRLAVRCTEEAVQIHGGYGYIEEYPVCRFYRDAKILTIGEGTDEVQQMVIARALGA